MPLDLETINEQKELLAAHRRTLAHLLQQAAQFGGEVFAPPQTANGIAEARASIHRIKAVLRKNDVRVSDDPNDKAPQQRKPAQAHQAGDVISGDKVAGDKVGGDKVMGDKRTINTQGGDYAEGNIDKRQGAFVEGNVYGTVIGQQVVQQMPLPTDAEDEYRVMLFESWATARGKLTSADLARLKVSRARLRLSEERAQQLEKEVLVELVMEKFNEIPKSALNSLTGSDDYFRHTTFFTQPFIPSPETLARIGRCVLLHEETTLRLLLQRWPSGREFNREQFRNAFLSANRADPRDETYVLYQHFLKKFAVSLAERYRKRAPPNK